MSHLKRIHQYRNAEIKRNNVAAVLNLTSYDWSFDIVPCFKTEDDALGHNFYFIPDGNGHWQMTDPRVDRAAVTQLNQEYDGNILNVIRIIKFWNKRRSVQTMPSYLIEAMILNYYRTTSAANSQFVDLQVAPVLEYIANNIFNRVNDPKGIQGDINTLTIEQRYRVNEGALRDARAARTARQYEINEDRHMSTLYWYDVFGDDFPRWG